MIKSKSVPSSAFTNPVHLLAMGFGSGAAKKAPGTWGTVAAVIVYWPLTLLPGWGYVAVVLIAAVVGIYLCDKTAKDWGVHDHGAIVWDEFVGYWITMMFIPVTWYWALIGFGLFRLFDIWKPGPIGYLDKYVHGGLGIMLDDILAGIFAWGCLFLIVFIATGSV